MRPTVVAWLALVAVNGALWVESRSVSREQAELRKQFAESSEQMERERASSSERQRFEKLKALAHDKTPFEPLGVAPLRDLLIEAERGLAVERLALDFRSAARLPAGPRRQPHQCELSGLARRALRLSRSRRSDALAAIDGNFLTSKRRPRHEPGLQDHDRDPLVGVVAARRGVGSYSSRARRGRKPDRMDRASAPS